MSLVSGPILSFSPCKDLSYFKQALQFSNNKKRHHRKISKWNHILLVSSSTSLIWEHQSWLFINITSFCRRYFTTKCFFLKFVSTELIASLKAFNSSSYIKKITDSSLSSWWPKLLPVLLLLISRLVIVGAWRLKFDVGHSGHSFCKKWSIFICSKKIINFSAERL